MKNNNATAALIDDSILFTDSYGRPIADNQLLNIEDFLVKNSEERIEEKVTDRIKQNPYQLIWRALGSPITIINKIWRFITTLFNTFYVPNQKKRLQRLKEIGFIDRIPSQKQLWFGAYDMFRYFVIPGAASYYKTKGINFKFHILLRFLNDPSGLTDPIGIRAPKNTIIGHLLEVVHANPVYDLQLLDQFDDGLDEMEKQTLQMIDKTHPRYSSISAIIEDENYYQDLYKYIQKYKKNPATPQLIRATGDARNDINFVCAEITFGTLPSAFRYFNRLPNDFRSLLKHVKSEKTINLAYCDPLVSNEIVLKAVK
ncbi:MAG TPA: hypothetical protein VFF27_10590 [Bacteroidia bacterium]|jgi:hypothetical protein|nr:hypothetical protein [Bacteroidia bacterium]